MKFLTATAAALAMTVSAGAVSAACDDGEIVVKFSHVTNTELPGNVTRWKPGEWLNLSDFVEEVPEKELHGILRNASLHLNISRSVSLSA